MKYFDEASAAAEELANVLIHNKYLLDDIELLKAALFARFLTRMGEAYQDGVDSIPVSDLSYLINAPQGAN